MITVRTNTATVTAEIMNTAVVYSAERPEPRHNQQTPPENPQKTKSKSKLMSSWKYLAATDRKNETKTLKLCTIK